MKFTKLTLAAAAALTMTAGVAFGAAHQSMSKASQVKSCNEEYRACVSGDKTMENWASCNKGLAACYKAVH